MYVKIVWTCSSCSLASIHSEEQIAEVLCGKVHIFQFLPFLFLFCYFWWGKVRKWQNTVRLYLPGSSNYISNSSVAFATF